MKYLSLIAVVFSSVSFASTETTPYTKITGIETRGWGMHVQVDVSVGQTVGCRVEPGATYMLDLNKSKMNQTGENYEFAQSAILAAFMAQSDISFHIYECTSSGRPIIGHIRLKR